jgi:protein transport protein YIF1
MMRSPPPPLSQQQQQQQQQTTNSYGNPYQPQPGHGANGAFGPGFGGFINDPTAQMGFQMGKSVAMAGQEYMEHNVSHTMKGSEDWLTDR